MKLELDEKTAKEIYPGAPDALKTILIKSFGDKCFRKTDFKDFKTFVDLCLAIGITEIEFNKRWNPAEFDPSTIAFERLKVCTRAYNQEWPFNAYDTNQRKYYPWFEVLSSGFGFSHTDYYYDYTDTSVGSRLCTDSSEKALYAFKQCEDLYKDWML
jgi:hypothetical protein